jgi:hypothetical protein
MGLQQVEGNDMCLTPPVARCKAGEAGNIECNNKCISKNKPWTWFCDCTKCNLSKPNLEQGICKYNYWCPLSQNRHL